MTPDLPVLVPSQFRIIAHRGASAYAPENTLAAFLLAERIGAHEIELDVQFSRDRQLIVIHDDALDRYGYPGLAPADLTFTQLDALDMGSWFSPYLYRGEHLVNLSTLFEVFRDRMIYHVELKAQSPDLPGAVLECVKAHGLSERTIITSFHFDSLAIVKKLAPDQRVGWLLRAGEFNRANITRAHGAGFFQICPVAAEAARELVELARGFFEVRAHSVRGRTDMLQVIQAGCDGLTINWPDWLRHASQPGPRLPEGE
jgi:glycerophosphoryl diester phosphodiesterase